ncbi:unnamed protein product, partial [Brenthis ino]
MSREVRATATAVPVCGAAGRARALSAALAHAPDLTSARRQNPHMMSSKSIGPHVWSVRERHTERGYIPCKLSST